MIMLLYYWRREHICRNRMELNALVVTITEEPMKVSTYDSVKWFGAVIFVEFSIHWWMNCMFLREYDWWQGWICYRWIFHFVTDFPFSVMISLSNFLLSIFFVEFCLISWWIVKKIWEWRDFVVNIWLTNGDWIRLRVVNRNWCRMNGSREFLIEVLFCELRYV